MNPNAINDSFTNLWATTVDFIPRLLAAIVVLIIGLIIANLLSKLIEKLVYWLKLDHLFNRIDMTKRLSDYGLVFTISNVLAWLVKWFIILVTLISVADILRMPQVSQFIDSVVLYIPNIFAAIVIITLGLIAGEFIREVVYKTEQMSKLTKAFAKPLALVAEWSIITFSVMTALIQLRVAVSLINILFSGLVFMFSLGGALAFGLGGRDSASRILGNLEKQVTEKTTRSNGHNGK